MSDAKFPRALSTRIFIAAIGSIVLNLSATSVTVATAALMHEFSAPLDAMQWSVTGYLLAMTLVLPSFRWAVERLGSRRLYVASLLTFGAASLLCALAWSFESLLAFRILQGAAGGMLAPLAQTLIAQLAGPRHLGRAVGLMAVPALVAPIAGPVLGGAVLEFASWRWLFFLNVPLAVTGAWLGWKQLPRGETASRTRLDLFGLALLASGMALFTWALTSPGLALPISIALIVAFVARARRTPQHALLDLSPLSRRPIRAFLATYLLVSFGSFGAQFVLPLYLQQVRGESAFDAGMVLAPQGIGMLLTLPRVGHLTDRFDHGKIVIAGVLITFVGTLPLVFISAHTPYALLIIAMLVRGAGLGATNTPALAAAYRDLAPDEIPNATTVINVAQRLGAQLGTLLMAVALQHFLAGAREPSDAFAHTFALAAALSIPAIFAGLALVRR